MWGVTDGDCLLMDMSHPAAAGSALIDCCVWDCRQPLPGITFVLPCRYRRATVLHAAARRARIQKREWRWIRPLPIGLQSPSIMAHDAALSTDNDG